MLHLFQIVNNLLIYQEAAHRNLTIKSFSGESIQLNQLGWLTYWFVRDFELYYSYVVKRNTEQVAIANIAKLNIDNLTAQPEIVAKNLETVFLRGANNFSIDPSSLDVFYSGGNQNDKPSIYLLEPNSLD